MHGVVCLGSGVYGHNMYNDRIKSGDDNMNSVRTMGMITILLFIIGCSNNEQARAQKDVSVLVQEMANAFRKQDTEFLLAHFPNEVLFIESGVIKTLSKDQMRNAKQQQFAIGNYEIENLQKPRITVSSDGKTAYVATQFAVKLTPNVNPTNTAQAKVASLLIFEKRNGRWYETVSCDTYGQ